MTDFGWSYPPGAENDPSAPYNQDDDLYEDDERDPDDNRIYNIRELARDCYARDCEDDKSAESAVSRGLFKYTECGCTFYCTDTYVLVGGYCEGSEYPCESFRVNYPFTEEQFWEAVEKADKSGSEVWNMTHGCEDCWPELSFDEFEERPVNPDCKSCGGNGAIT